MQGRGEGKMNKDTWLKQKEAELMCRWKERWREAHGQYPYFNPDGIVDHDRWNSLPEGKHILVILKETNGLQGSLADFLRNGGSDTYYRTWNNVARWVRMLLENSFCETITRAGLQEAIKNIAAINIKKYAGGATANPREVRREALKDVDLLREQIRLYRPDIILTGGWGLVSDFVHDVILEEGRPWDYNPETDKRAQEDPALWYFFSDQVRADKRVPVISMPHLNRAAKKWTEELAKCPLHPPMSGTVLSASGPDAIL